MRCLVLLLLCGFVACAHAPAKPKLTGPCATATSPQDLVRARASQQQTYRQAGREVRVMSQQVEMLMKVGVNARNQSARPLTVDETLAVQTRLSAVRHAITKEADRLDALAESGEVPDPPISTAPAAAEPRLSSLRASCMEIEAETNAEMVSSQQALSTALAELKKISKDYELPVNISVTEGSR